MCTRCAIISQPNTESITQFGVEQKANVIVTLVKIMTRFCHEQNPNKRPTIAWISRKSLTKLYILIAFCDTQNVIIISTNVIMILGFCLTPKRVMLPVKSYLPVICQWQCLTDHFDTMLQFTPPILQHKHIRKTQKSLNDS